MGYPGHRAPRARRHRARGQRQAQQAPVTGRYDTAAPQATVRQEIPQGRKHGKQIRLGKNAAARADVPTSANRPAGQKLGEFDSRCDCGPHGIHYRTNFRLTQA
jgi:hypothetical protein